MKKFILTLILSITFLQLYAQDLISGGSNSWIFHTPDVSSPGNLHIAPKINGVWDWSKQVTVTPDGIARFSNKIGIGNGNNNPEGVFDARSSNNMRITLNRDNQASITFIPNIANSWFHISHGLNNNLHISQGGTVGQIKLFTIESSGNVGIGTTAPDEKLTVKGKIHAEEVRVDLSVPADYVFQKYYDGVSELKENYKMPTLEEVEAFTKKNHHLPEVPSAAQIQKEGLHLKQMTNLLLQKIEELTLYTIEQEKRIKALEVQLSKK